MTEGKSVKGNLLVKWIKRMQEYWSGLTCKKNLVGVLEQVKLEMLVWPPT